MADNRTKTKKPLTAAFVRSVKEAGKYGDGNGLMLVVKETGAKQWVQRITIRGKRTDLGLGSAELVSLAEAREVALANRKLAMSGGDPLQAKREAQAIMSFEEASRTVYELHKPTWKNAKHSAQFISTLETYAFPHIGKIKIGDINTSDILRVLTPIWNDKHETARRVRQRISTVMKWAIGKGWRQDDPAHSITSALPKPNKAPVNRKALHYRDASKCIKAVQSSGAGLTTMLAIEFLILTATRSGEVRGATWDEFQISTWDDANHANHANPPMWIIPASRMKAKQEHRIPLSERAAEIINEAKLLSDGSKYVFYGTKHDRPLSDMTLSKLIKELGFDADVHGFRTSFRTWAQEQTDFASEIAEAALAHKVSDKVVAAYARSDYLDKRTQLMKDWAEYLTS